MKSRKDKDSGVALLTAGRKQAGAALHASESWFRLMFERTADALMLLDARLGRFIDCNQAAVDLLRCTDKKELLALHPAEISPPRQPEGRMVGVGVLYASEPGFFDEEEVNLLTELAGNIAFALDHIQKGEQLNYLAYYDALTGLPNRSLFFDRLNQLLRAAGKSGAMMAVVLIDLERFRGINEMFGRHTGDAVLKQVVERLGGGRLGPNHLARISADSFAAVLDDVEREADAVHFVEKRVIEWLHQPILVEGRELRISAKAGITLFPADGADADTLFRNAEAALRKAKLSGDKYLFYTSGLNARVAENLMLENKLRRALEDWGKWRANGLQPPRIAVNVSAIQLRQKDFVGTVERVLSGAGDAAGALELEITESLVMQDIEANIEKLRRIRDMGVEVAVDDFGTGYSSLSYIAKLPIHTLKIDRAFIISMTGKSDDLSIVSTIISLAHSLNLKVVAEGVETEEQVKLLWLLKCDEMQGYLFSPAVPAEEIERFLREKETLNHG